MQCIAFFSFFLAFPSLSTCSCCDRPTPSCFFLHCVPALTQLSSIPTPFPRHRHKYVHVHLFMYTTYIRPGCTLQIQCDVKTCVLSEITKLLPMTHSPPRDMVCLSCLCISQHCTLLHSAPHSTPHPLHPPPPPLLPRVSLRKRV
jgi:hypothetical protein